MTSRWYEGFPLSVIEAMYYGTPVLVPELAGLPEIVDHGKCGAIYAPGSADRLAEQLARLAADPQLASDIGSRGRQRVIDRYNPDVYYRLLIENTH